MGLETQSQGLGRIDPSSLIGQAETIVEPRATAMLTDAFRQGVVTADDVLSRIGELGKAKKKAELNVAGAQSMQAQEAMSPEAQAARAAQMSTAVPAAELQNQQIEQQKILIQYPAVAYFQKFAPMAGIEAPKLPDGTPDYKEMERIGAELAVHESDKSKAAEQLANITTKDSADGSTLFAVTKQGEFVDPKTVQSLRAKATRPFQRQTPGTFATPTVEPRAPQAANPDADRARAAAVEGGNLQAATLPDSAFSSPAVVQARPVIEPGMAPVGTPVAGGMSLGPPKPGLQKVTTAEQDKAALALSRFAESRDIQASLQEAGYDPTSYGSWVSSMLPQVVKTGDRKLFETAVEAWGQGLLRLESGAAISPKEKTWYMQTFFPTVNDTPSVVLAKEGLRGSVERSMAEIALKGGVISPEAVRNAARIAQQDTAAAPSGAGKVVTLPSGKKVSRNANGTYTVVQ